MGGDREGTRRGSGARKVQRSVGIWSDMLRGQGPEESGRKVLSHMPERRMKLGWLWMEVLGIN